MAQLELLKEFREKMAFQPTPRARRTPSGMPLKSCDHRGGLRAARMENDLMLTSSSRDAEIRFEQAHERLIAIGAKCPAKGTGCKGGVGNDELLAIVAVEFPHDFRKRFTVKFQASLLPGERPESGRRSNFFHLGWAWSGGGPVSRIGDHSPFARRQQRRLSRRRCRGEN